MRCAKFGIHFFVVGAESYDSDSFLFGYINRHTNGMHSVLAPYARIVVVVSFSVLLKIIDNALNGVANGVVGS